MPQLTPEQQFEELKKKIFSTLQAFFPVEKGDAVLKLHGVEVDDKLDVNDIRSQKEALLGGRTWAVPVYADVSLERGGKVVDRRKILVMDLPKTTDRYGYIVAGKKGEGKEPATEYQSANLFRLKSGVYHRVAEDGSIVAEFNLRNRDQFVDGRAFKLSFDPKEAVFYLNVKDSAIPAYHLLRDAGISDETLEKAWGREVLEKNKAKATEKTALRRFYKVFSGKLPEKDEEIRGLFRRQLDRTELLPETTARTLGKPFKTVENDTLVRSSEALLGISRGSREADDRHSLEFNEIFAFEDLINERLQRSESRIKRKIVQALEARKRTVRGVLPTDEFRSAVHGFFRSSLANPSEQTNPLEMIGGQLKTTIMGDQGGIKSVHAIVEDAKLINPSHLGYLDPIHTPENEKTGVSLTIPLGTKKKGTTLYATFRDARTGKLVDVDPGEAMRKTVAFPDQYDRKGRPIGKQVKASREGEIVSVSPKEVDLVLPSPRGIFDAASNLIPFLQNNQGNRAMTAARQQEQAVPLVHREAPLVQVKTDTEKSFEEVLGTAVSHRSPIDGTVVAVKDDAVIVKDRKGKTHEVQVYRNYPLAGGSLYDSEVKVKAGDRVRKGQVVADTTFSKDGALALGTNLRTGYMPFLGYNFDDGIVVSESAAQKLTSAHVYRKNFYAGDESVRTKKAFLAYYPYVYKKDQTERIDDEGVIRVGSKVQEGDPLILSLRKPTQESVSRFAAIRRGRPLKFKDSSLTWDKPYPGIVTDIVRSPDGTLLSVFVKTQEPAQVADKLVGRHGNKGVITRIIPDVDMPYKVDPKTGEKQRLDIVFNPLGVPGRINLGQVLETVAGKIAEKKGQPYKVRNFEPGKDYLDAVRKDLKDAGLSDKEVLIDPKTGEPFEQSVLTGNQYILKLRHQAEKKLGARSGGPGMPYNINHAPTGGPPYSGMTIGELGLYALLAHGARENVHEMFTYKSSKNDPLWDALREGMPLPPPKVPFAYEKFLAYLNGMRVNVRKEGSSLQLLPFTEKQLTGPGGLSSGELPRADLDVIGKNLKPEKGGLFDERLTGGMDGTRWTHFKLAEPLPNPLFEEAVKYLTGLNDKAYRAILRGDQKVGDKTGGLAIEHLLKQVDVKKERAALERRIVQTQGETRNKLHRKLRILRALEENDLDPTVYMMRSVPVIPPTFRPITLREDARKSVSDLNGLYKYVAEISQTLEDAKKEGVPDVVLRPSREQLYDGLSAITGISTQGSIKRDYAGIIDVISGRKVRKGKKEGSPKEGYFHKAIIKRRQDFTGRSVIVPEPAQGLDELGVPEKIAWTLYEPFAHRELVRVGYKHLDAKEAIENRTRPAEQALLRAMEDRPILLKRDPVLHKFNVMAFKPRLVSGKAIEIHPLVTSGFNADFDGDAMSVRGDILVVPEVGSDYAVGMHAGTLATHRILDIKDFPRLHSSRVVDEHGSETYDVPPGVLVPAFDGRVFKNLPVTKFHVHPRCQEWLVQTRNGREIRCAQDHSLVLLDPETLETTKATPGEATGRCLPTLRSLAAANTAQTLPGSTAGYARAHRMDVEITLTEDVGWFVGASIGDGWVSLRKNPRENGAVWNTRFVSFAHGRGGEEVQARWARIGKSLCTGKVSDVGEAPHTFDGFDCVSAKTTIYSTALGTWLEPLIGVKAVAKHLPERFLEMPLEFRRGLLAGLIDTDGTANWSASGQFALAYSTSSPRLAEEIVLLGLSLGLPSSTTKTASSNGIPHWVTTFSTRPVQDARWLALTHPAKREALRELQGEEKTTYGRNDFVPLPEKVRIELLDHLRDLGAARKGEARNAAAFSQYVVLNRKAPTITRTSVDKLVALLDGREQSPYLARWFEIARDTSVGWDLVERAEPTGQVVEMYDLTVPGAWTFTMANGAVVWDSVYLPITPGAVREAREMFPSNNLFNPATGAVMYTPGHEALLGLYLLSQPGKKTSHSFKSIEEARSASRAGKIKDTDVIRVDGKETTLGRLEIEAVLPEGLRETGKKSVAEMRLYDKKGMKQVLTKIAKDHPQLYGEVANRFKDLGNDHAYRLGFSIGLDDFAVVNKDERDRQIAAAERQAASIRADKKLSADEKRKRVVDLYKKLDARVYEATNQALERNPTNIYRMVRSGSRGDPLQLSQIVSSPTLVMDAKGRVVPTIIPKSYSEGMDVASYWTTLHGARKGTIQKVQGVVEPGYISKLIINATLNQLVTDADCGTKQGTRLSVDDHDVLDRYLSASVKLRGKTVPAGTLVTPELVASARASKVSALQVRSPLRCELDHGVCQKCLGLMAGSRPPAIGTNIGVIAAQSIGEPSTQLSLNSFHCHHEGTLVTLRHGSRVWTISMKEAFESLPFPVWTHDDHEEKYTEGVEVLDRGGWVPLEKVGRHRLGNLKMLLLRTETGHVQALQENHPVMVRDKILSCPACQSTDSQSFSLLGHQDGTYYLECDCGERFSCLREDYKASIPRMRAASAVQEGNLFDVVVPEASGGTPHLPGYLVGMIVSEGSVRRHTVHFRGADEQKGRFPRAMHGAQVTGLSISQVEGPTQNYLLQSLTEANLGFTVRGKDVFVAGRALAVWAANAIGVGSQRKHLPYDFLGYGDDWLWDALAGLIDGDGTVVQPAPGEGHPYVCIDTTSFPLVQQLGLLAEHFGLRHSVFKTTVRDLTRNQGFSVRLHLTRDAAEKLVGRGVKVDGERFDAKPRRIQPTRRVEKVTYIREILYSPDEWVYDVTSASGTFLAGSIWTHNTGGLAKGVGAKSLDLFSDLQKTLYLYEKVPDAATLSAVKGKVQAVQPAPQGGYYVRVGGEQHYVPEARGLSVKKGDSVEKGQALSGGTIDPRQLLVLRGLSPVQDLLTGRLFDLLKTASSDIKRRNIEVVVKSITNLARVEDPGDHPTWVAGDMQPYSQVSAWNREHKGKKPVKFTPELKSLQMVPLELQEDWIARLNAGKQGQTLIEAAREGWKTNIHSFHPIPAVTYGVEFGKKEKAVKPGEKWRGQY